jgi:hypothetical protein
MRRTVIQLLLLMPFFRLYFKVGYLSELWNFTIIRKKQDAEIRLLEM